MTLDEAYEQYRTTGNVEVLGEPLLEMLKKTINKKYGSKLRSLDDMVGDVCVEVFKDLPTFDGHSKFSTWVTKIANTTCLDRLRRKGLSFEDATQQEIAPDFTSELEAKIEVKALLSKLEWKERELMLMKLEGCTDEEIAQGLGYASGNTVNHIYKRVLEKLRTLGGGS